MSGQSGQAALRANFRNLYLDILWFGVLAGSVMAFITIYVARLGASAFQISLLTAGPAAVNLLFSLPAGQWLAGRALIPVTFWSATWHRLGYLVLVPLVGASGWLQSTTLSVGPGTPQFGNQLQIWIIVSVTLLMSIPGTLLAISFNALFAEVVPADWRAEVVGKRNAIVAVSLTVTTLLCGQLLDHIIYPLNYTLVFAIGAAGAALSTYYLGRLRLESSPGSPSVDRPPAPHAQRLRLFDPRQYLRFDILRAGFGSFMLVCLLFYTFQYLGIPLFPLVQVNVLQLSDGMISLGSGLFYGAMLLVSLRIIEISTRWGHKRTLAVGATAFASYPLLLGLARGPALFWAASFMGGGAWAITNAGLTNRLMERVPDDQRPSGMAVHNLGLNLGILFGSLAAPLLGEWAGLQNALFIVAALRLLVSLLFWKFG